MKILVIILERTFSALRRQNFEQSRIQKYKQFFIARNLKKKMDILIVHHENQLNC